MKPLKVTPRPITAFEIHQARWKGGCGSECCARARKVVLYRGKIPCDVLFCGEGPGVTEDVTGFPFVGKAGKKLDEIVGRGMAARPDLRVAFTNVVGCLPTDEEGGKSGEPSNEQIQACLPRLEEFIRLARPRLIIAVGRIARDHLEQGFTWSTSLPPGVTVTDIMHPAALLRLDVAKQILMTSKSVIAIRDAVTEVFGENEDV